MKRLLVYFLLLTILIIPKTINNNICYATNNIQINIDRNNYNIDIDDFEYYNLSKIRQDIIDANKQEKINIIKKLKKMGFNEKIILNYIFPQIDQKIDKIAEKVYVKPINAGVISTKNCKIDYKKAKNGVKIDKNSIYTAIFDYIINDKQIELNSQIVYPDINIEDIKDKFVLCGSYKTKFNDNFESRKNNILRAVSAIDGIVIKSGETFSFNNATGLRNEENGYQAAKIIENGKYVEGYGGGVCQVSSTLYNAALLSGLTIVESNAHSLKSSYVEPGFDAMVNYGSADLKIKNESDNDFIITALADSGVCKISIYGAKSKYKIILRNEIVELENNEDNTLHVKTFADYYMGDILVKTKHLRDSKYKTLEKL